MTTSKVSQVLDQVDMLNSFAQGLKMQRGTDYIRAVDGVLSKNGGPNRNVTIPAAGGVSNEGQSYKANLQVAMEYIGARAYGDDVNFSGLKSSPNEAFRSNISSYFASLKNSSVGAVTGAMADGAGVVEVSLGLTTYRSTEAVDKIIGIEGVAGGGRVVAERSYAIGRGQDVDAVVALKNSNKLDISDGRASNGNLKIVMGTDGAEDPIKFAINLAGTDAFKNSEFAVQNPDGTYSKINIQGGQVSSEPITTKQIQDLYDRGAQNLVTIIGRGGATGDSIKTAGNIPGITITSSKTPVGLVAQAGARIDRGSEIADQYALIIAPGASKVSIDKPMTVADFSQFKNEIVNNQKIVEQAKNTQALDQGVTTASNKVLENLIFESSDAKVQEWASNLLLKFSTEEGLRDLDLDGGSQTSLAARQKKVEAEIIKWKEVLTDPANASILKQIASNNPELYKTILTNAGVKSKLAYAGAGAQANTTKEAVITADNLEDFIRRHNLFVTSDAESKVVASSGRQVETEQIATKNQQNSNEANKAEAELNTTKDTIKDLANVVANPIKMAIELGNGNIVREVLKTPARIINYAKNLDAIQENAINNYRAQRETLANLITNLEAETDVNLQADLQQQIDNLEKEIAAVPLLTKASNFVNERVMGEGKGRVASVLNFFTNLFSSEEITPEVIAQKDKAINDLKITDEKVLANLENLKTSEEIANFVSERQAAYQKLKDQFTALNTSKPAVNNEEDYQAQKQKLAETLKTIQDLQNKSGLAFIVIGDDGSINRVNQDQFKNLSTFRVRAEVQIEKLAKEAVAKVKQERMATGEELAILDQIENDRLAQEEVDELAKKELMTKEEKNAVVTAATTVINTIGRDISNSLQTIPGVATVSRKHAEIIKDNDGNLYVHDLKSTNGTYVNGQRIDSETNVLLNENDTLFIGNQSNSDGVPFQVVRNSDGQLELEVKSIYLFDKPIVAVSDLNNFDPVEGLNDLHKTPRIDRPAAIAKYKENLILQKQGIANVQEFVISSLEKNPDLNIYKFIEETKAYALNKGLNFKQIEAMIGSLRLYESKKQRAEEIMDLDSSPNVLFEKTFGIKPIGNVQVKRINHQVVFYLNAINTGRAYNRNISQVTDSNNDFINFVSKNLLPTKNLIRDLMTGLSVGGFQSHSTKIPNSKNQVLAINTLSTRVEQEIILRHEMRHVIIGLLEETEIFGANTLDSTFSNFMKTINDGGNIDEFKKASEEFLYDARKNSENRFTNEFTAMIMGNTKGKIGFFEKIKLFTYLNFSGLYKHVDLDKSYYQSKSFYEYYLKNKNYVESYLNLVNKHFGFKAQLALTNDVIKAYNTMIDKGYSQEETFAIFQSVRADHWLKNANRMPSLVTENLENSKLNNLNFTEEIKVALDDYAVRLSAQEGADVAKINRTRNFFNQEVNDKILAVYTDLLTEEAFSDETKLAHIKANLQFVLERAFDQHLDNPEQYVSHGFDHTLNVVKCTDSIIETNPELIQKVQEKYGIGAAESKFLLRTVSLFHDFGYPVSKASKLGKAAHGMAGADIINYGKVVVDGQEMLLRDSLLNLLGSDNQEIIFDLRDGILFHSADKVEHSYGLKIKTSRGDFLLDDDEFIRIYNTFLTQGEVSTTVEKMYIYVENLDSAEEIKKQFIQALESDNIDAPIPEMEFVVQKFVGRKIDFLSKKDNLLGLEFSEVALMTSPLQAIIRLADNMDMQADRFSTIQNESLFQAFYKELGAEESQFFEVNADIEASLSIAEKALKADKSSQDTTEKISDLKKLISTNIAIYRESQGLSNDFEADYLQTMRDLDSLDIGSSENYWKEFIFKEITRRKEFSSITNEKIEEIRNIALKQDSYSYRHFGGCEAVRDVRISSEGVFVEVDQKLFDLLNQTKVSEKVSLDSDNEVRFIKIGVGEYQIWRMSEAYNSIRFKEGDDDLPIFVNGKRFILVE